MEKAKKKESQPLCRRLGRNKRVYGRGGHECSLFLGVHRAGLCSAASIVFWMRDNGSECTSA